MSIFELLWEHLETRNSETRILALLLWDVLFSRSVRFREATVARIQEFVLLTIGDDRRSNATLPPPRDAAVALRTKSIQIIEVWHEKFAARYQRLRNAKQFLERSLKVTFPKAAARAIAAEADRRRHEENNRRKRKASLQARRVRKEIESGSIREIEDNLEVMERCLEMLVPGIRSKVGFGVDRTKEPSADVSGAASSGNASSDVTSDHTRVSNGEAIKDSEWEDIDASRSDEDDSADEDDGFDDFDDFFEPLSFFSEAKKDITHPSFELRIKVAAVKERIQAEAQQNSDNIEPTLRDTIKLAHVRYKPMLADWISVLRQAQSSDAGLLLNRLHALERRMNLGFQRVAEYLDIDVTSHLKANEYVLATHRSSVSQGRVPAKRRRVQVA